VECDDCCRLFVTVAVHLTTQLLELFDHVDTDGSGGVSWDEFSSFVIAAGIAATLQVTKDLEFEVCGLPTRAVWVQS
jgi:hypothetical protein